MVWQVRGLAEALTRLSASCDCFSCLVLSCVSSCHDSRLGPWFKLRSATLSMNSEEAQAKAYISRLRGRASATDSVIRHRILRLIRGLSSLVPARCILCLERASTAATALNICRILSIILYIISPKCCQHVSGCLRTLNPLLLICSPRNASWLCSELDYLLLLGYLPSEAQEACGGLTMPHL